MRSDSISNSPCTADCDYGQNMETVLREGNSAHEDERRCDDRLGTTADIVGHDCQVKNGDTSETLGAATTPLESHHTVPECDTY